MTGGGVRHAVTVAAGCVALVTGGCTASPTSPVPTPSSTGAAVTVTQVATATRDVCAREADAAARVLRSGDRPAQQLVARVGVDTKIYQVATRLNQIYTYTRISESTASADQQTHTAAATVCDANGDPTLTRVQLVELEKSVAPGDLAALQQLATTD